MELQTTSAGRKGLGPIIAISELLSGQTPIGLTFIYHIDRPPLLMVRISVYIFLALLRVMH